MTRPRLSRSPRNQAQLDEMMTRIYGAEKWGRYKAAKERRRTLGRSFGSRDAGLLPGSGDHLPATHIEDQDHE